MDTAMLQRFLNNKWLKRCVFALCCLPAAYLITLISLAFAAQSGSVELPPWLLDYVQSNLTANPVEYMEHTTGDWTIYFLLITLSVTPLRKLVPQLNLIRFRRMFGLYAFFYGFLHFFTYGLFDQMFSWMSITMDVYKRPFITVGFLGFVLLIPLAITSTAKMIRRLGGRRWNLLHRLIYVTGTLGVIHYYWLVKSDVRLPLLYGGILTLLFLVRIVFWLRSRQSKSSRSTAKKNPERAESSAAI
jgi:methionine sulfoxide reductase heme-binding subunit